MAGKKSGGNATQFPKSKTTSDLAKYTGSATADRTGNKKSDARMMYDMAPGSRHMSTKRVLTDDSSTSRAGYEVPKGAHFKGK